MEKPSIQFIYWKVLTVNPEQVKQNKHSRTPTSLFQHWVVCFSRKGGGMECGGPGGNRNAQESLISFKTMFFAS